MKDLDIEKLERKNIYKVPDNFLEQMQKNVLQKTTPVKKGKIVKLNWIYSAAAAIALLFGITFFINQNKMTDEFSNSNQNVATIESSNLTNSKPNDKVNIEPQIAPENPENDFPKADTQNKTGKRTVNIQNIAQHSKNVKASNAISTPNQNPEIQLDQVLANFTSAELADIGRNSEQDVYLDLYN